MNDNVFDQVGESGIVAVLVPTTPQQAVAAGRALLAGGVRGVELALRTPTALEALTVLCREVPELLVGAGTVLEAKQVQQVKDAGAAFAVAPGCNVRIIDAAREAGVPFAPGVATPSDIEAAVEAGCRVLKFFPAELTGGLKYLQSAAAPYDHLGLRYIPLGGVTADSAAEYLKDKRILAVGGSWLAKSADMDAGNWAAITEKARAAVAATNAARAG